MYGKLAKMAVMLTAVILLTGCRTAEMQDGRKTAGKNGQDGIHIVTSFSPCMAVINVAGDVPGVTVTNMTEPDRLPARLFAEALRFQAA